MAGASRWRDDVAGSERAAYAPPFPGASPVSATAGEQRGDAAPRGAEDRHACLVGDDERHRKEDARLVKQCGTGVDPGEPRHEAHEHVPERKRVAGVQPTVYELVHGLEPEVVERLELADAGEVEERIAVQLPCDRPERDAERDSRGHDSERKR